MTQANEPAEKTAIVKALRHMAGGLGTTSVTCKEFLRGSGITKHKIERLFGTYNALVKAAGLVPRELGTGRPCRYSNQQIITEIARVLQIPNSELTTRFFAEHSRMSKGAILRRFGSWFHALGAMAETLDPERHGGLLSRIRAYTAGRMGARKAVEPAPGGTLSVPNTAAADDLPLPAPEGHVPVEHGTLYGDFIHFRGLVHAPINEQGVIFLFGMICRELGYVVEVVKLGFPDCEAKRQVRPGIWERVRIEFEFRSRTFRNHGHDPSQCDVIVCWEDNWPDCPIEVQELKSALSRLSP